MEASLSSYAGNYTTILSAEISVQADTGNVNYVSRLSLPFTYDDNLQVSRVIGKQENSMVLQHNISTTHLEKSAI